jgi:valyl-tRNA synthetase
VQQFIGNIIKESKPEKPEKLQDIDIWILTKYSKLVKKCTRQMDVFDYSQAMKEIEYFLWHELADHYIEMIKGSIYHKENVDSIRYTLYTVGLGLLKLFAPIFPHITEEIYWDLYKDFEDDASIHVSTWPKPILIDEEKEKAGDLVKSHIAQVRHWKSGQGLALNAPINATTTYYPSAENIQKIRPSGSIIISTLKYPADHEFKEGKPNIEETITAVEPVYAKLGPVFKNESQKISQWIKEHQNDIIKIIENKGDISISEIPGIKVTKKEGLLKGGYIQLKKEAGLKGKKGSIILSFDGFYVELQRKKS